MGRTQHQTQEREIRESCARASNIPGIPGSQVLICPGRQAARPCPPRSGCRWSGGHPGPSSPLPSLLGIRVVAAAGAPAIRGSRARRPGAAGRRYGTHPPLPSWPGTAGAVCNRRSFRIRSGEWIHRSTIIAKRLCSVSRPRQQGAAWLVGERQISAPATGEGFLGRFLGILGSLRKPEVHIGRRRSSRPLWATWFRGEGTFRTPATGAGFLGIL